jgi:hypothetical protein
MIFCQEPKLSEQVLNEPSRTGPMACYKNYMTVPAPTRLLAMLVTVYEMASLSNDNTFRLPFSSYSASLTLHLLAPYDGSAVAEDWHKLIKAFFASSGTFLLAVFLNTPTLTSLWNDDQAVSRLSLFPSLTFAGLLRVMDGSPP